MVLPLSTGLLWITLQLDHPHIGLCRMERLFQPQLGLPMRTFGAEVQYTTLSTLAVLQAPGNYYFTLVVDNGYHMNVTSAGISVSITPNPAFLVFNGTNPVVVNYGNAIQLNWTIFDDSFNLSGNPSTGSIKMEY